MTPQEKEIAGLRASLRRYEAKHYATVDRLNRDHKILRDHLVKYVRVLERRIFGEKK